MAPERDDDAMLFFQLATEFDVSVAVHPPLVGFGEERTREYRLACSIGRPLDGPLAIARLIVRGVFEKFPTLERIGTHLGSGICVRVRSVARPRSAETNGILPDCCEPGPPCNVVSLHALSRYARPNHPGDNQCGGAISP
jgi:hypothetical protein